MKSLIPARTNGVVLLDPMCNEMDEMFQRFFGWPVEAQQETQAMTWAPRVDISETDKGLVVKADLPGVDPKDVEVTVRDGILTIRGEKKEEHEEKQKNFHRVERFCGQFFRSIPLPTGADESNVVATSGRGVLTVTILKKPEAQPKKIAVNSQD